MSPDENKVFNCGVKFCGGCNPKYERGLALADLKSRFTGVADFNNAEENTVYDLLLVIGGCTNCCASYKEYIALNGVIKMWDKSCIEEVFEGIERILGEAL